MAPVRIPPLTAEHAKQQPRAFALLAQVPGYDSGTVDSNDLKGFADKYGDGDTAEFADEVSFDEIVAAFRRTSIKVGNGAVSGLACKEKSGALELWSFDRRELSDEDIRIQIAYCGICHSDLNQLASEWGDAIYPMIPGHEIVGIVVETGKGVKKFKVGDRAGVGWFIESCRECQQCAQDEANYCSKQVPTFAAKNWRHNDEVIYGGWASQIVVAAAYAVRVPASLPLAAAAPLLCAGITTFSPLQFYGLNKPGQRLGIIGMGGLGHIAVKLAKALCLHVTVISTSEAKRQAALDLGADSFLISKDEQAMAAHAESLDGILDTVAADHAVSSELGLLKPDGKLILLGIPPKPTEFHAFQLILRRRSIAGSAVGGIGETQAMLVMCSEEGIVCEIEEVPGTAAAVNEAIKRLAKGDVRGRFVVDVQGSLID